MIKASYIQETFPKTEFIKPENCIYISYSQYSNFQKCPLKWKLTYIDKIKESKPSIHGVFGTAMHNVLQHWLQILFNETVKKADALDFDSLLLQEMKRTYSEEAEKYNQQFSTKEQLTEFYIDGLETLKYIRKKRTMYFDRQKYELVGTELPLLVSPIDSKSNVVLMGFLDCIFKEKKGNKFKILDFKTSTKGWNKWDKDDQTKIDQLLLYKLYFSKQYNVPIENIDVEFIILKRKIDPDSMFPQRRVQVFKPSQGSISYKRTLKTFESFINFCFLPDGNYNSLASYEARCGKNNFNCRFCEFDNRTDLCPKENRI